MDVRTTKAFDLFLSGLSGEGRTEALDLLERKAVALAQLPPGPERAREVHRRVDEAQAKFAGLKPGVVAQVRCGRGCSHCCRLWVDLTKDEADLLALRVAQGKARPSLARMEAQSGWASPAEFIGKPREEAACVFLGEDGACTVYEDRPAICRAVLVASDPEYCKGGDLATRITAVINPYAEVEVSAALTVDARQGPPGRHLAHELQKRIKAGAR
jgi:Fe-S-cluster containining protein